MDKTKIKTNILIIGGGPAGIIAAVAARSNNPDKKIILVRDKEKNVIPCGIPYIFNRLDSAEKNIMPDEALEKNKIDLVIDKAYQIDPEKKKVFLKDKQTIKYEKLIMATGSQPNKIPVKGLDKKGVFVVEKDLDYLKEMRQAVVRAKDIFILGGGFIGMELAEEISSIENINITIIERKESCLGSAFDKEFCQAAESKLKKKGVKIYKESTLEAIEGEESVEYVKINDQEKIPADLVILSVGSSPDISLANSAGVKADKDGIEVNQYMQTNIKDIFAVGDCAKTKNLCTGKCLPVMLASTACSEARIAGANLYELKKENEGTLGAFSTCLDELVLGAAGLTEEKAISEKINVLVGQSECSNHHPGTLPNTEKIKLKLIFNKDNKILIGGEVMGPESVAEMINIISVAIQKKTTIDDLKTMQFATHPLLTAAPTIYPIIAAAQSVL